MSIIKAVLAGVGLAAVGYGAYKGAQYLIDNSPPSSGDCGDEVNTIIENAATDAEADLARKGLGDLESASTIIDSNLAPAL